MTVLLVEQRAQRTVALADRTYVMTNGEMRMTLTPADADDTERIVAAYLAVVIHVQNLIDAIGLGAVFALIAVGIGLVFGVLRLINFAYGQLIMVAAYTLAFTDSWPDAASVLAAVLVAVVASLADGADRVPAAADAPTPRPCSSPPSRSRTCSRTRALRPVHVPAAGRRRRPGRDPGAAQPGGHDRVAAHPLGDVPRHRRRDRVARRRWRCC